MCVYTCSYIYIFICIYMHYIYTHIYVCILCLYEYKKSYTSENWNNSKVIFMHQEMTTDLPWLTTRLHPDKPIISWQYRKSKMRLIHQPTKHCSSDSPTLETLRMPHYLQLGKNHATQSLFHNKVPTTSCDWWNRVLEGDSTAAWIQNGCQCAGSLPSWS